MNSAPNKILLLALSGIGNFLMQSPVFAALKKAYPDSELTVWVPPRGTKILADNDRNINQVIVAPIRRSLIEHIRQTDSFHRQNFNLGIVLYPGQHLKSAGYLFAAGIHQRIGHRYRLGRHRDSTFLLTDPISNQDDIHDTDQNLNLLKPLGIKINPNQTTPYNLDIPSVNQQQARDIIRQSGPSINRPLIAIHAGSAPNFLWKRWSIDNFVALASKLVDQRNAKIFILGGPDEQDLKQQLKNSIGAAATIINTDLLTTAALMQQSQLVVSNDSGLMHLAAASGATTLGLFGPTDEKQTGPRASSAEASGVGGGQQIHIIRAPHTKPVYHVDTNFDLGDSPHQSLQQLTPELVLDKISRILPQ